jgi:predicted site-specific integrase-resolvase
MNELDVTQVKEILELSYPTALKFAREHGRLDPAMSSRGKWLVPAEKVREFLESERATIDRRLAQIPNGRSQP